jgi:hypothetical protein
VFFVDEKFEKNRQQIPTPCRGKIKKLAPKKLPRIDENKIVTPCPAYAFSKQRNTITIK